tara:strand:- start:533 stop:637 length:105 start_codon:yes stop_codon:yes gene_type:complete
MKEKIRVIIEIDDIIAYDVLTENGIKVTEWQVIG